MNWRNTDDRPNNYVRVLMVIRDNDGLRFVRPGTYLNDEWLTYGGRRVAGIVQKWAPWPELPEDQP